MSLDLNCDLGEGEPLARTRGLMRWITSANIACGGHAGDARTMRAAVRLAREFKVNIGAHPGPWSRSDKGRGKLRITPDELELLLLQQVGALKEIAGKAGASLHHLKLHGSLYHAVENDLNLARRYVAVVRQHWPELIIFGQANGGRVIAEATRAGVSNWPEAFADRAYDRSGRLVPRSLPGAVLSDVPQITSRVKMLTARGQLLANDGKLLAMKPRTLCVHADSPNAIILVRRLARLLATPSTG